MRFLPFYLVISGLFCIFALTNFRNMVYYRYLFKHSWGLSPNEGLVYSALLSHSLMSVPENFDVDGTFSIENAKAFVADGQEVYGFECIDISPISTRKLSRLLGMSEDTVRRIKTTLRYKYHLYNNSHIVCPLELLDDGYMDLPNNMGLKGRQLVFYGLLKERSRRYGGVIDTWASRLAEMAGINKTNAHKLIAELQRKRLVERLEDGKLKIR